LIYILFIFRALWFLKLLKNNHFFRWIFNSFRRCLNQFYNFRRLRSSYWVIYFDFIWNSIWIQIYQICTLDSHTWRLYLNLFVWLWWYVIFINLKYRYLWLSRNAFRRTIFHLNEIKALRWLRRTFLHQSNRSIWLIYSSRAIRAVSNITFTCSWRSTGSLYQFNCFFQRDDIRSRL